MTARKPRKPIRIWVAVDSGGVYPWTAAYTRKDCRRNIKEWLGATYGDQDYIDRFPIKRATLVLDPPRKKGGRA